MNTSGFFLPPFEATALPMAPVPQAAAIHAVYLQRWRTGNMPYVIGMEKRDDTVSRFYVVDQLLQVPDGDSPDFADSNVIICGQFLDSSQWIDLNTGAVVVFPPGSTNTLRYNIAVCDYQIDGSSCRRVGIAWVIPSTMAPSP